MQENEELERQSKDEGGRRGVLNRAKGVVGAAKQQASRSAEVLTGKDIRRFDDFTDATTRAVVGVHQDQAELRERLAEATRTIEGLRRQQSALEGRLETAEQAVRDVRQQQLDLRQRVDEAQRSEGPSLSPATIAVGVVSGAALLLGIAAIVLNVS